MSETDSSLVRRLMKTKNGGRMFLALMVYLGHTCPECYFATRITSKRWARCKKCNLRVERHEAPEAQGIEW